MQASPIRNGMHRQHSREVEEPIWELAGTQKMSNEGKPLTGPSLGSPLSFAGKSQKGFECAADMQRSFPMLELPFWGGVAAGGFTQVR